MDQAASDDEISLRTYADQLCPDEAAALKAPIIWDDSPSRIELPITPTLALQRSSLRAMAEAIIEAAADGRCAIWRDGVKLPASFFINERVEALRMIEPALTQDDSLFRVRPSGRGLKSRARGANAIDDGELLRKVKESVQGGHTSRQAIIRNLPSNITAQQQDTVVRRIQRKRREGRES
jgi:hypothetical protein